MRRSFIVVNEGKEGVWPSFIRLRFPDENGVVGEGPAHTFSTSQFKQLVGTVARGKLRITISRVRSKGSK